MKIVVLVKIKFLVVLLANFGYTELSQTQTDKYVRWLAVLRSNCR